MTNPPSAFAIVIAVLGAGAAGANWAGTVHATHFWDCSGASCDSKTLQPWNPSKYRYAPQYAPQDPADHGGALYGEKLWLTGAASDAMSAMLGADDGCCGVDTEGGGGCGKCLLVQTDDAVKSSWTAVVLKKNRCPPWSNNCGGGKKNMDIAAPGFDNLQYSTANTCGQPGTYFSKSQSGQCGAWYNSGPSAQSCRCQMPSGTPAQRVLKRGCELFARWGWKSGTPTLKYRRVPCPPRLTQWVGDAFGAKGVQTANIGTASPAPATPAPPTTPAPPAPHTPAPAPAPSGYYTAVPSAGMNSWWLQVALTPSSPTPQSVTFVAPRLHGGGVVTVAAPLQNWGGLQYAVSPPSEADFANFDVVVKKANGHTEVLRIGAGSGQGTLVTPAPKPPATKAPVTAVPATPVPATPVPATATPVPATTAPVTPRPETPRPATSAPTTPAPAAGGTTYYTVIPSPGMNSWWLQVALTPSSPTPQSVTFVAPREDGNGVVNVAAPLQNWGGLHYAVSPPVPADFVNFNVVVKKANGQTEVIHIGAGTGQDTPSTAAPKQPTTEAPETVAPVTPVPLPKTPVPAASGAVYNVVKSNNINGWYMQVQLAPVAVAPTKVMFIAKRKSDGKKLWRKAQRKNWGGLHYTFSWKEEMDLSSFFVRIIRADGTPEVHRW